MTSLKKLIEVFLPDNWICNKFFNELQLSMLSFGFPRVTQRVISVDSSGGLKISVHGKELHHGHKLYSKLPQITRPCRENVCPVSEFSMHDFIL